MWRCWNHKEAHPVTDDITDTLVASSTTGRDVPLDPKAMN